MRLHSVEINGFGRIAKATLNLAGHVIAIVGPNEAGKSTLLDALQYLGSGETLPAGRRTRGLGVADADTIVKAKFDLDEDDRAAVKELDLASPPSTLTWSRRSGDTKQLVSIEPEVAKNPGGLVTLVKSLKKAATKAAVAKIRQAAADAALPEGEVDEAFFTNAVDSLEIVGAAVVAAVSLPDLPAVAESNLEELRSAADRLRSLAPAAAVVSAVDAIASWVAHDVAQEARDRLFQRRPDFLLFDGDARDLRAEYDLAAIDFSKVPSALANLAAFAELDLAQLKAAIDADDTASKDTQEKRAQKVLRERFSATWKQSEVTVSFRVEGTRFRIVIEESGDEVTPFAERSTGLRMFVSLACFLATRTLAVKPILLIDEAETHLHIDAQSDLVRAFEEEQQVAKVIYTTHSPACLLTSAPASGPCYQTPTIDLVAT